MGRVVIGLLKGLVVGALIGFGALKLGIGSGGLAYAVQGAVGFAVGLICGKPLWRQETLWTPIVKGIFGLLIAMGLTWVARRVLNFSVPLPAALGVADNTALADVPLVLGAMIGGVYGAFVEVDDGGKAAAEAPAKAPPAAK